MLRKSVNVDFSSFVKKNYISFPPSQIQLSQCFVSSQRKRKRDTAQCFIILNYISFVLIFFMQVLVMTPQILLRNLYHRFIKMELITLLIFDECHHAQIKSNHQYAAIMKVKSSQTLALLVYASF